MGKMVKLEGELKKGGEVEGKTGRGKFKKIGQVDRIPTNAAVHLSRNRQGSQSAQVPPMVRRVRERRCLRTRGKGGEEGERDGGKR